MMKQNQKVAKELLRDVTLPSANEVFSLLQKLLYAYGEFLLIIATKLIRN